MKIHKDLTAAAAPLIILQHLSCEESYGYNILKAIKELSGGEWEWTEGMLYPILHRLEKQGFAETMWKTAPTGRKRKYYKTTKLGLEHIRELDNQWTFINNLIHKSQKNKGETV